MMDKHHRRMSSVRERAKEILASDTIETIIRLVVVLSIVLSISSSFITLQLQECSQLYQEANAHALQARDIAAAQDRSAMDGLVTSISLAKSSEDVGRALQAYIDTRAKSDALRAEHPLPIPERFC